MLDERAIRDLQKIGGSAALNDLCETALALWKVLRAARQWQEAGAGEASVEAEDRMQQAIDAIIARPHA